MPESTVAVLFPIAVVLLVVYAIYRAMRQKVFTSHAEDRVQIAFPLWEAAFEPYGWRGKIKRALDVTDVDVEFSPPEGGRWMSLFGGSGTGMFTIYEVTDDLIIALDLVEATHVGVRAALRASSNASHLAVLLDEDAERAFDALPTLRAPGRSMTLEIDYGLSMEWGLQVSDYETALDPGVIDPAAFTRHLMALEHALLGHDRVVDTPDAATLLDVTRTRGPIASMLAARALLTTHSGSPQAREWVAEHTGGSAEEDALLLGWTLEEVEGFEHGTPAWCDARALAIIQGDTQTGVALARHALDVVEVYQLDQAVSRILDTELDGEPDDDRNERVSRDRHLFACFMIAACRGTDDAERFATVYEAHHEHVKQDFEVEVEFAELMGDLDGWHPELVTVALSHGAHDDVYAYWVPAFDEAWTQDLAMRLLEVAQNPNLGPTGMTAIMKAAARHDLGQMLGPARLAISTINAQWSTDSDDTAKMRAALKELESRITEAQRSGGHLSLAMTEGGELSMSTPSHTQGGLEVSDEVTLDFDEDSADQNVSEEQEATRGDAW